MPELEKFDAKSFSDSAITLKNIDDIPRLLKCVENGQNFIIKWQENGQSKGKLVVVAAIEAGIKNGKVSVYAEP